MVNGCANEDTVTVADGRIYPVVTGLVNNDVNPAEITCGNTEVELEAFASSTGLTNPTFNWTAGAGGNILNTIGVNDTIAIVDAAADYSVVAVDPTSGCTSLLSESITVDPDFTEMAVSIDNGLTADITCANNKQLTLTGVVAAGDPGTGTYEWTTAGGNIIGPTDAITALVDAAGTYTFTYYHSVTECPRSISITVSIDQDDPIISIDPAADLTCTPYNLMVLMVRQYLPIILIYGPGQA
jgi:hypothetical protein